MPLPNFFVAQASAPADPGTTGAENFWFDTTNGVLKYWDGAAWTAVAAATSHSHTATIYATSNTTQGTSGTPAISSLIFAGAGVASVGVTNGSVVVSVPAGGGGLTNVRVSAGTTSNLLSDITFADSNGLAFGLNASTLTGSYTVPTVTNSSWTVSDAATSGTVGRMAFTNLNGVTLSLSSGTGGSHTIVGSHNALTSQSTQYLAITLGGNTSGTTTFHATNNASIFLHGGNNITLSGNGSSITVSAANPTLRSYWAYPDHVDQTGTYQIAQSTSNVFPVWVPYDISISFVRLPLTLSIPGSMAAVGTAANVTRGLTVSSTFMWGMYSQNVGASSRSIQTVATSSATWQQRATIQAGAVGSNWSSGHTVSFPREGGNTDFTNSAAATSASFTMQSSQLSDFTGMRFFDVPFATSLSAGAYWVFFGSSTSSSSSGTANISTLRILASLHSMSQPNLALNLMGSATNSSNHYRQGIGSWTTNSAGTLVSQVALSHISTSASHVVLPFQLIRQA